MYKVVLVDDEPWALLGISSCFEWEKHNFDIICATTNPKEALDVIKNQKPDLVMTDICMPHISGVDIMRMTRNAGIDSEFIIVSGYSDFIYAKEAIRYGAFHYLLKPIDKEEVNQTMVNLLKHLAEKKTIDENPETVNILFNFPDSIHTIVDNLPDNNLTCSNQFFQVVVALGLTPNEANTLSFPSDVNSCSIFLGEGRYVFFLNTNNDLGQYAQSNWSDENHFVNTVFGISTLFESADDIYDKFVEADIAANTKFMQYPDKVCCYQKVDVAKEIRYINDIINEISMDNSIQTEKLINDIRKFIKERKPGVEILTLLYNQILTKIYSENMDVLASRELKFTSYDQMVRKHRDVNDLIGYIKETLLEVKVIEAAKNKMGSDHIDRILEYIDLNYDKPIFLSDISQKFFISANYICDLFKKSLGKTFIEYLTELRLKKADKLLKTTDFPILKIGEMSGYGDYCYFGKIFKKYYGMSPTVYRNKMSRMSD